jgi:hypothetical protein
MTLADILKQQADARAMMQQLAKMYPHCFDSRGRPIVASTAASARQQEPK